MSAVVQLGAILILSLITDGSSLSILWNYYLIMQRHIGQPGIHLAEIFAPGTAARVIAPIVLTLGFAGLMSWLSLKYRFEASQPDEHQFHNLHVFSVLVLWTPLVAYHRPYDGMLVMFFFVLLMVGLSHHNGWHLALRAQYGIMFVLVFTIVIFILPYEEIGILLPTRFAALALLLIAKFVILTLIGMLLLNLWLLYKVRRPLVKTKTY